MIKIRLQGELSEIEQFLNILKNTEKQHELTILEVSSLYKNRGNSAYYRQYLDIKIDKNEGV